MNWNGYEIEERNSIVLPRPIAFISTLLASLYESLDRKDERPSRTGLTISRTPKARVEKSRFVTPSNAMPYSYNAALHLCTTLPSCTRAPTSPSTSIESNQTSPS